MEQVERESGHAVAAGAAVARWRDHRGRRLRKARDQRRRDLQVLGDEEGADGRRRQSGEGRQRQPAHSGTTATLGTENS